MKATDLIKKLQELPSNANIVFVCDKLVSPIEVEEVYITSKWESVVLTDIELDWHYVVGKHGTVIVEEPNKED